MASPAPSAAVAAAVAATRARAAAAQHPAAAAVLGSPDLAGAITRHVEREDLLAWSLASPTFRRAQVASGRALITPARAMMRSVALAEWAWPMMEPIMIAEGRSKDLPAEWAAEGGQVEMLEWLRDEQGCDITGKDVFKAAGQGGHLETLKFLQGLGCEWGEWCMWGAARGGLLEVVKWLRANGCPWEERVCCAAALGGHLHVLQWLRDSGCPWDERTVKCAAEGGHVHILQWLLEHGCPMRIACVIPYTAMWCASHGGHADAAQWLLEHGCEWTAGCSVEAAVHGHVEVLRWAAGRGLAIDEQGVMYGAVKGGHIEVLRWWQECGLPLVEFQGQTYEPGILCVARVTSIKEGNIDMLEWALDAGCTQERVMSTAAKYGKLEVLKWGQERGFPLEAGTVSSARDKAIQEGNIDLLRWAADAGCTLGVEECATAAATSNLEVLKFIRVFNCLEMLRNLQERGCPWDESACAAAARGNTFKTLKYLRERGCPWDERTSEAASGELLEWAIDHGCPYGARLLNWG